MSYETAVRRASVCTMLVLVASLIAFSPSPAAAEESKKDARPVSLELKDADLHDVINTFAQLTGRRIDLDPGITGTVSVKIVDKPWTEALLLVIEPLGLAAVYENEGLRIFRPTNAPYQRLDATIKPPQVVSRVEPLYPAEARKDNVTGLVVVEAQIDETGAVRETRILKDVSHGLGAAAEAAVRQWVFSPALREGKPVSVVFNITVNFKLDETK